MAEIGKYNNLQVVKFLDFGIYLDGGNKGEILLPIKQVPPNLEVDDFIEVFIYNDSEDRIIATTREPYGIVGDFVLLKTVEVNKFGAFMDWGLEKNLLVPFREQKKNMEPGRSYIVYIYLDEKTQRIVATAKLDKYMNDLAPEFETNQEVDLMILNKSDLGYNALINNTHSGILYENELFQKLNVGQKIKGFIKKVREDEKIDLYLLKPGYEKIDSVAEAILQELKLNDNFIELNDKSNPQDIYDVFSISKKNFKKAIGSLYKNKLISIDDKGITLLNN